jgi:hypothetical protein
MSYHVCEICEGEYYVSAYRDEQTRVCSFDCERERRKRDKYRTDQSGALALYHEEHNGVYAGSRNPRWTGEDGERACSHCGKKFRSPPCRTGKYCSNACRISANKTVPRDAEILRLRGCGVCVKELSERFGLHSGSVYRIIKRNERIMICT